jgi:serpin B
MLDSAHSRNNSLTFLFQILQKAYIDVNELGTEAGASTAATFVAKSLNKKIFKCDHPFLFYIKENVSGIILFLGKFTKPQNR